MTEVQRDPNFTIKDTTEIQTLSLILFAAGIGYEPQFDIQDRLRGFRAPQFDCDGDGRLSVQTMIDLHNYAPAEVFADIKSYKSYKSFMEGGDVYPHRAAACLFASTLRLVEKVKGVGSRRQGLIIQSGMVKFTSHKFYLSVRKDVGIK